MKKLLFLLTVLIAVTSFGQNARKSPHDTVSTANTTVTYGRPYKNDRNIFGELEKYGRVWRVGADEATTITFKKDVKVGDKEVKAGTYTLFAIPNENEWTIIINSKLGQWGAYSYEKTKGDDVAKINVPTKKLDKVVEQLTIRFAGENAMIIEWDKTQVTVPLKY
ncbi:hypothetical protein CAP36_04685 [Chitinophagaceae bacterium IBVUCB2]|nr:hypothetical protein CAP36_04685 [Chitinophagaceae bacterium IBVUCB2]